MNILKLDFKNKKYPYANEGNSSGIVWGEISLSIYNVEDLVIKNILKCEWDFKVLLNWFLINRNSILTEECPFIIPENLSIADSIRNIFNDDSLFMDTFAEILYRYRESHGLHFALRGINVDEIYFGKIKEGGYEVSLSNDFQNWKFNVDLPRFFEEVEVYALAHNIR